MQEQYITSWRGLEFRVSGNGVTQFGKPATRGETAARWSAWNDRNWENEFLTKGLLSIQFVKQIASLLESMMSEAQ